MERLRHKRLLLLLDWIELMSLPLLDRLPEGMLLLLLNTRLLRRGQVLDERHVSGREPSILQTRKEGEREREEGRVEGGGWGGGLRRE